MNIFVSYTMRDGQLGERDLLELEKILSQFGSIYIDYLHNNSAKPQEMVFNSLARSNVLIAILTPKYFLSKWTWLELFFAIKKRIPIHVMKKGNLKRKEKIIKILNSN